MNPPNSSSITLLAFLPLLAWRAYSRFRRMVGRQRLSRIRPWITIILFPTLLLLIAYSAHTHADRLWWLGAGLPAGAALGVFGLRHTRFEPTPQGLFYTPNAHLGIALSLLFVARIIYRVVEVYAIETTPANTQDFVQSPVTLAVFGILAGYYIAYAIGLVRWRNRVLRARKLREQQAREA